MTLQRRHLVAILVMAITAAVVGAVCWQFARAPRPRRPTAAAVTPFTDAAPSAAQQRGAQRARAQQLGWGRDPFHPWSSSNALGLLVSGIIWDATQPMAVINDQTYLVGDKVDGYHILAIHPGYITCTDGIQTYRIDVVP